MQLDVNTVLCPLRLSPGPSLLLESGLHLVVWLATVVPLWRMRMVSPERLDQDN